MQRTTAMVYENSPTALRLNFFKDQYDIYFDEVDNIDYRYEATRLDSFRNWPAPWIQPKRLAAAGFYFTGELDIVKCFECGTEIYKWVEGDDPMTDHKKQSPMCKFICNFLCGNIPIDRARDTPTLSVSEGKDICGLYEYEPEHLNSSSNEAKYPRYDFYEARLRTFEFWPELNPQNPLQLAAAGFYYTGMEDQVLCFHCGVGVRNWEPNDDPWEQHAIWYPKCLYLLMVKGLEYINNVTGQPVASEDSTETSQAAKEESLRTELNQKVEHKPNYLAGSSSQSSSGSHDSGTESMSSNNSSPTGSTECLSDVSTKDIDLKPKPGCSKSTDDARMCKICFSEELCQLFLPCNHLVACTECAKCIKVCPICRRPVIHHMQIFFS